MSSNAASAAGAPFARSFGWAASSLCARRPAPPTGRPRPSPPWRRRTGAAPFPRRRRRRTPRADRRRQTRARRAREGERPFEPLRQHGSRRARPRAARPPLPGRPGTGAGACVRARRARAKTCAAANGAGRLAAGAGLGGVDRLLQRLVMRNPQNLGGDGERGPPMPGRATDEFPPGDEPPSRGSGIGARPGEMERVAQRRLVLGPACARARWRRRRSAPGDGGKRPPRAGFAGRPRRGGKAPRRRERRLRPRFPADFRPRPRRERRRRGGRRPGVVGESARSSIRRGYATAALSPRSRPPKPPRLSTRKECPIRLHYQIFIVSTVLLSTAGNALHAAAPKSRTESRIVSTKRGAASDARLSTYLRGSLVNVWSGSRKLTITRRCYISPQTGLAVRPSPLRENRRPNS